MQLEGLCNHAVEGALQLFPFCFLRLATSSAGLFHSDKTAKKQSVNQSIQRLERHMSVGKNGGTIVQ